MKKNYEELDLTDDFMFGQVMSNRELCKETLETLLEISISSVEFTERQKVIDITGDGKSVRLDMYVRDEKESIYDAEMQRGKAGELRNKELPKRSRYYQGLIDLNLLEKGTPYHELNECYIIFICTFDPFGKGLHRYVFKNTCQEDGQILLGDKTVKIFFNTTSEADDVSEEAKMLLEYMNNGTVQSGLTQKLDGEVRKIRASDRWRREYMKTIVHDLEVREEGREEGIKEGEGKLGRLIAKLLQLEKTSEIEAVTLDEEVREKYYRKYGI